MKNLRNVFRIKRNTKQEYLLMDAPNGRVDLKINTHTFTSFLNFVLMDGIRI